MSCTGLSMEYACASYDVKSVIDERGMTIKIDILDEQEVKRDKFNSIKKREVGSRELSIKAFPVVFSPTDKEKSDSGIRENTQVIIWTAMKDWIDNDIDPNILVSLDAIRTKITIMNVDYEIRDKNMVDQFGDNYLYVTLGLNRK